MYWNFCIRKIYSLFSEKQVVDFIFQPWNFLYISDFLSTASLWFVIRGVSVLRQPLSTCEACLFSAWLAWNSRLKMIDIRILYDHIVPNCLYFICFITSFIFLHPSMIKWSSFKKSWSCHQDICLMLLPNCIKKSSSKIDQNPPKEFPQLKQLVDLRDSLSNGYAVWLIVFDISAITVSFLICIFGTERLNNVTLWTQDRF